MTAHRFAEKYLARAQELDDYANRVEHTPPTHRLSPRWRDPKFVRREAACWRALAAQLGQEPTSAKILIPTDAAHPAIQWALTLYRAYVKNQAVTPAPQVAPLAAPGVTLTI